MDGSTCPFIGPWCSLVWERRTTCWVTMRVPDPDILVIQRPPLFREGRDLVHHVPACSEGARACWGRGVGGSPFGLAPFLLGGGGVGAAKSLLPSFLVPKGNQPTACTLALWWLKFGPTEGWGEGRGASSGGTLGWGVRWGGQGATQVTFAVRPRFIFFFRGAAPNSSSSSSSDSALSMSSSSSSPSTAALWSMFREARSSPVVLQSRMPVHKETL